MRPPRLEIPYSRASEVSACFATRPFVIPEGLRAYSDAVGVAAAALGLGLLSLLFVFF